MSTRSQVIIKDDYAEQWFYRHSDGYPAGNLPCLYKYMLWLKKGLIRDNVEQSSGWLVLIGAEEYGYDYDYKTGDNIKKKTVTEPSQDKFSGWKHGAYEICPCKDRHGDIEWLYTIDIVNQDITIEETREGKEVVLTFAELEEYKDKFEDFEEDFFGGA